MDFFWFPIHIVELAGESFHLWVDLVEKFSFRYGWRVRKQGSEKSVQRPKIFIAIRSVFAYSEESFAGSSAGGTLPIGNPGLPEKACNPAVCGPLCRSQFTAALKGSKIASRKAARVGK